MGILNSFLGGALGQGLQQTAANMEARDARREQIDAHERQLREQSEARQRLQDDRLTAAMDRVQARIDSAASRGGGTGGSGRRALIERDQAEIAGDAANELAAKEGLSLPEAQRQIDAYQSGDNPFRRQTRLPPDQVLDPRDAKAGAAGLEPDEEKFRQVMRSVATAFKRSRTVPKDAKDAAEASGLYQQEDITSDVRDGRLDAKTGAQAVAAGAGKGTYRIQGNTRLETAGGDMATTEVGRAEIRKDDAQAADHNAKAGKTGVEKKALQDNGGMTPTERTGLLNSYRAMVDDAQREVATATQRLEKAQSRKATLPADKTAKAEEVSAAQDALDAAGSKKARAEQNLAELQQERRDAGKAKPKEGASTKKLSTDRQRVEDDRRIALSMVGKPKKGGGTVTREDVAARFKAAYGEEL